MGQPLAIWHLPSFPYTTILFMAYHTSGSPAPPSILVQVKIQGTPDQLFPTSSNPGPWLIAQSHPDQYMCDSLHLHMASPSTNISRVAFEKWAALCRLVSLDLCSLLPLAPTFFPSVSHSLLLSIPRVSVLTAQQSGLTTAARGSMVSLSFLPTLRSCCLPGLMLYMGNYLAAATKPSTNWTVTLLEKSTLQLQK